MVGTLEESVPEIKKSGEAFRGTATPRVRALAKERDMPNIELAARVGLAMQYHGAVQRLR